MRQQRLLAVGTEILQLVDSVIFSTGSTGQLRMHEAGPSKAGCLRRSRGRPVQAERRPATELKTRVRPPERRSA